MTLESPDNDIENRVLTKKLGKRQRKSSEDYKIAELINTNKKSSKRRRLSGERRLSSEKIWLWIEQLILIKKF